MLQTNIHCCNTNMFLMFFDFSIHWLTIIGINPFSIQIHDLHRINPARVVDPHENCHGHNQFSSRNPHDQQGKKKHTVSHTETTSFTIYSSLMFRQKTASSSEKKQLQLSSFPRFRIRHRDIEIQVGMHRKPRAAQHSTSTRPMLPVQVVLAVQGIGLTEIGGGGLNLFKHQKKRIEKTTSH